MSRTGWTPRSVAARTAGSSSGGLSSPSSSVHSESRPRKTGTTCSRWSSAPVAAADRGGEGRRLGGRLGAVDAAGDLRREGGAGRAGEHHRTGRVAEHVLRDPAHADRPAEQTAVGSETHEVGVAVARLGHQHLIGVAGEDPQVGDDPEPLRLGGGSLERGLGLGLDVGIVRPIGLDDVDDVERGTQRRGDPGALASRLLRARGPVGADQDPVELRGSLGHEASISRSTICRMPPCR